MRPITKARQNTDVIGAVLVGALAAVAVHVPTVVQVAALDLAKADVKGLVCNLAADLVLVVVVGIVIKL